MEDFDPNSTQIFTRKTDKDSTTTGQAVAGRDAALAEGSVIDNFTIIKVLGIGGFGIVYLAKHNLTDAQVAIKEFFPSSMVHRINSSTVQINTTHDSPSFAAGMESFVKEAKTLAKLHHAGLVQVLHFWEGNGTAYMVMPYYEGETLKAYMSKPDFLTTPNFVKATFIKNLLNELLPTLEYLHERDIFHRDIAPDNIFLLKNGKPLLLDFGAARHIVDQVANVTTILKEGYAPVEQYDKNGKQGAKTDIYALSAVLYHFITGRPPQASVTRVYNDPVVSLEKNYAEHYPLSVLKAIDAGLIVNPNERPASIAAWKVILQSAEIKPTVAPVIESPIVTLSTPKPKSNHKSMVIISLIAVAAIGAFVWQQLNRTQTPETSPFKEQATELVTQLDIQLNTQQTSKLNFESQIKQIKQKLNRSQDNKNTALVKISLLETQEALSNITATYKAHKTQYEKSLSQAKEDLKKADSIALTNATEADAIYNKVQQELSKLQTWSADFLKNNDARRSTLTHSIDGKWTPNSCTQNVSTWKVDGQLLHVSVNDKEIATEKIIAAYDNSVFTHVVTPNNEITTSHLFEYRPSAGKLEVSQGSNKQYLMRCN